MFLRDIVRFAAYGYLDNYFWDHLNFTSSGTGGDKWP